MAAGLTDHVWSAGEVLTYQVAPAFWVQLKRRGRQVSDPFLILLCPNDHEVVLARAL